MMGIGCAYGKFPDPVKHSGGQKGGSGQEPAAITRQNLESFSSSSSESLEEIYM